MLQCARWSWAGAWLAGAVVSLTGCLPFDPETDASLPELVLSAEPVRPPVSARYTEAEPNDEFDQANLVSMIGGVELAGGMAAGSDLLDRDLYELGPADAGDRIQAQLEVDITGNIQLALFDDQYRLLGYVNPSSWASGPAEIDIVLRESTSRLYAVAATRSGSLGERSYTAYVGLERSAGWPTYQPQIVVLDFQGGDDIRIGHQPAIDIPPFDAANINPAFAGQTEWLVNRVMEMVAEDYAGLDVAICRASDPNIPAGERSTVYFGTYNERLLGLADNIDPFNADHSQSAVLYTDTFSLFSVLSPGCEEIAQVLANVTSHEVGHLLGLRHTADPRSIMDITASARQMLLDQWFSVSDLHASVMSIGVQDAPALLAWTLGGTPPVPPVNRLAVLRRAIEVADDPNDFYVPRSELATCFCPGCAGQHDRHEAEVR